jgi:hypothetical protein
LKANIVVLGRFPLRSVEVRGNVRVHIGDSYLYTLCIRQRKWRQRPKDSVS